LDHLYSLYAEAAIRTAFLVTRNRAAAEDAVQEAFVQVIRSVSTLRDPASFRPWFYRIVINVAKRLSRSTNRSLSLDLLTHDQVDLSALSPDESAIGIEEIQLVRAAVADLNEAHREVIILRYYTGLSDDEMAVTLGVPIGTIKSRLHRAREALHERLERNNKPPIPGKVAIPADWNQEH
jgi:RNA polymerase sigma-70 factor (ECF subfamily)